MDLSLSSRFPEVDSRESEFLARYPRLHACGPDAKQQTQDSLPNDVSDFPEGSARIIGKGIKRESADSEKCADAKKVKRTDSAECADLSKPRKQKRKQNRPLYNGINSDNQPENVNNESEDELVPTTGGLASSELAGIPNSMYGQMRSFRNQMLDMQKYTSFLMQQAAAVQQCQSAATGDVHGSDVQDIKAADVENIFRDLKTDLVSAVEKCFSSAADKLTSSKKATAKKTSSSELDSKFSSPTLKSPIKNSDVPFTMPRAPFPFPLAPFEAKQKTNDKLSGAVNPLLCFNWAALKNFAFSPLASSHLHSLYNQSLFPTSVGATQPHVAPVPTTSCNGAEPEQTEALSLVSSTKKPKRTKVTDTRLSPRAVKALLHDSLTERTRSSPGETKMGLPYSAPTMVSTSYNGDCYPSQVINSSPLMASTPPDTMSMAGSDFPDAYDDEAFEGLQTTTLSPMHLRKAKLMFFYVRYPNSALLKTFFPDIRFTKSNTAQLVKWFSNFREFYYIQMEKYARQALTDNITNPNDLEVTRDSELFRVINLHYNRNNQLEVPDSFIDVAQSTLREFFKAIAGMRDQEPSWKKAIYKIIQRMDDTVPEFFKSAAWMEQLAD